MHGIFTSTGNLVAWFESEQEVLAALAEHARDEPEAADEIAAIQFDDDGRTCGPSVAGSTHRALAESRARGQDRDWLAALIDYLHDMHDRRSQAVRTGLDELARGELEPASTRGCALRGRTVAEEIRDDRDR
jgi:hypothetical protein